MKTKNKKIGAGIGILIIAFILFSGYALAFAVSAPYLENKQLKLSPGESRDLEFVLQNGGGDEDINVKADILEGSEIAKITDQDTIYLVPIGERATVNVRVNIPEDEKIGETHSIILGFSTVTPSGSGTFRFGSSIEQKFDVIVGEEEKTTGQAIKGTTYAIIIAIILVIAILAFFTIRKRKKENR